MDISYLPAPEKGNRPSQEGRRGHLSVLITRRPACAGRPRVARGGCRDPSRRSPPSPLSTAQGDVS